MTLFKATGVYKSFGEHWVLKDISCVFESGKITGVIGPSGGGKSTLLKILGGVFPPDSGEICLGQTARADVELMFQEGALFDSLAVFDNVAFDLVDGRVPVVLLPAAEQREVYSKVADILGRVGLAAAAWKMPAQLSGGMRRRVSLARALVTRPKMALLDDPTAGLDPVASSVIMELIAELHKETSPATVIVSHDLRRLLPICDVLLAIFDGKVVFKGTLSELALNAPEEVRHFVSCRYDLNGNACHIAQTSN